MNERKRIMKKQYIFPLTEVMNLGTERMMSTEPPSKLAPAEPLTAPSNHRQTPVF